MKRYKSQSETVAIWWFVSSIILTSMVVGVVIYWKRVNNITATNTTCNTTSKSTTNIPLQPTTVVTIRPIQYPNEQGNGNGYVWAPDVLNNQYAQPVKNSDYIQRGSVGVSTNIGYVRTSYRQLGILAPTAPPKHDTTPELLVLMGRPLYVSRNKWQYYAITDQRNGLKLTIRVKGRSGTNEYGIDEVYTGDLVTVQGYTATYRVDMYENDAWVYE